MDDPTFERLRSLLSDCRDYVAGCVGSIYRDTDESDEAFLAEIDVALEETDHAQ